ncbi:MAG TPA: glucose-1-phosphate cytidylyltransferase [Planctomycetaceae bacterium]
MKTIILAGGLGTRLAEETSVRPKPMVEVGGIPILVHIMSIYHAHGFSDFVVACGYRGEYIKEFFSGFAVRNSDWSINLRDGTKTVLRSHLPAWNVAAVDTGPDTMTGGRIRRLRGLVGGETFMATYGDGVADVDLGALVRFHRSHGRLATVTAVHPPARFGCLGIDGDAVRSFAEKPQTSEGWINGGFFVFEPEVIDYIDGDDVPLERGPLERLSRDGQLMAFRHPGFWQPMDTLRDKQLLEELWNSGRAPWKMWNTDENILDGLSRQEGPGLGPHRIQGAVARKVA